MSEWIRIQTSYSYPARRTKMLGQVYCKFTDLFSQGSQLVIETRSVVIVESRNSAFKYQTPKQKVTRKSLSRMRRNGI